MPGYNPTGAMKVESLMDDKSELPAKSTVSRRLTREGRWTPEIVHERDRLLAYARDKLGLAKGPAQEWAYSRLGEKYPPLPEGEIVRKPRGTAKKRPGDVEGNGLESQAKKGGKSKDNGAEGSMGDAPKPSRRSAKQTNSDQDSANSVIGLGNIPAHWPKLPPNSSLATEIQWVQAVRIDVVTELPTGGVIVRLDKAERPAPSKAALGWLETSIRAYSKYCDIAAKAAANIEDEREATKRERQSIEQVRAILAEMLEDPPKP